MNRILLLVGLAVLVLVAAAIYTRWPRDVLIDPVPEWQKAAVISRN